MIPVMGSTPTTCGTAAGEAHLGGVERLLQEPQTLAACDACVLSDRDLSDVASAGDYGVRLALLESALRLSCRPEVSSLPNALSFGLVHLHSLTDRPCHVDGHVLLLRCMLLRHNACGGLRSANHIVDVAVSTAHQHTPNVQVLEALHALSPPLSADQQCDYEAVLELYGTTRMMLAVLGKEQLAQVVSGRDCGFYDVLEPVRAVRPVHCGAGHDLDVLNDLRMLHFQVDPTH